MYKQWIRHLPRAQREVVIEAAESASLSKVRRALKTLRENASAYPSLQVELLSTQNLEPVLPFLEFGLRCLPTNPEIKLAPLDDVEGHLAQPRSMEAPGLDARVLIWRVEEVLPEALFPVSQGFPDGLEARIARASERVDRVIKLHLKNAAGVPLFISTLAFPAHISNGIFSSQHRAGVFAAVTRINLHIYEAAFAQKGIYVHDLAAWATLEGRESSDALLDFMARQPLSATAQLSFSFFLARSLRPLLFPRHKVLAVDLDQTLWGGVIAEEGLQGLALGHDFPGNIHLRIQRELLELREQGVLLVLLSKNNEADAREGFTSHPEMLLKWDDFIVRKVNWDHKHDNLRAAANELSLGLDSFAFLDDSDFEREQMRQSIPEVLVLNESGDPLHMLRALWETDAFNSFTLSTEDRQRHRDYEVRAERSVTATTDDLEGFLRSLEMQVLIEQVGDSNLERVVSMLQKTNQFNLTTRRHSRVQVQAMVDQPRAVTLALRLRDKFGDQGIVATLLGVPLEEETLVIDSFLVSCRALGRGVEDALWAAVLGQARERGFRKVKASYLSTSRNEIVRNLYDRLGFRRIEESGGSVQYLLDPFTEVPFPGWISTVEPENAR
ncbi:MAG: HAD-IIIC family phosphatase [Verrucomicrobiota bacterium]